MVANRVKKPVFVHTNHDTRVLVHVSARCTAKRFIKNFQRAHYSCYEEFGKFEVDRLQVKHKSKFNGAEFFYDLTESILIEYVLGEDDRCLYVEISKSEDEKLKKGRKEKNLVDKYCELVCEKCSLKDNDEEVMLKCYGCQKGFHLNCLMPIPAHIPSDKWYCHVCIFQVHKSTLTHEEIMHFFGITDCMEPPKKCVSTKGSRKRKGVALFKKKQRKLLPYVPAEDMSQRLEQMASLASAMMTLNIAFTPRLIYDEKYMAPKLANNPELEIGGMQVLSKTYRDTLNQIHDMGARGLFAPLIIVYDSVEGYTVEAGGPIKDMTLIAEYAGDVDYFSNREHDTCDSLMTLLLSKKKEEILVIFPDKRGNIARFISGINNHSPESKKKINLKCVRYNIDDECRALMVATHDIAKGERLYYDYNGYENEFPTHNFV